MGKLSAVLGEAGVEGDLDNMDKRNLEGSSEKMGKGSETFEDGGKSSQKYLHVTASRGQYQMSLVMM